MIGLLSNANGQTVATSINRTLCLGLLLIGSSLLGCGTSPSDKVDAASATQQTPPSDKIAVVYYQSEGAFSTAVRAGAEAAAEEFKRELEWHIPDATAADQTTRFEQAISDKVAGICVCPIDPISQMEVAEKANEAGIPVAVFEQPMAQGPQVVTFAGTDHFHCGKVLLETITEGKKESKVLVIRHHEENLGSIQRLQGFETTAKEIEGLTLVVSDADLKTVSGDKVAQVKQWIKANDGLTAVAALTPADTTILAKAVKGLELESELPIYGFGAAEATSRMLQDGELAAIILEDPYMMGYSAVMAMVDHLEGSAEGEPMSDLIVTGEHLVTAETMDNDRNQRLLESNLR